MVDNQREKLIKPDWSIFPRTIFYSKTHFHLHAENSLYSRREQCFSHGEIDASRMLPGNALLAMNILCTFIFWNVNNQGKLFKNSSTKAQAVISNDIYKNCYSIGVILVVLICLGTWNTQTSVLGKVSQTDPGGW